MFLAQLNPGSQQQPADAVANIVCQGHTRFKVVDLD
jgi:hypothetical protein